MKKLVVVFISLLVIFFLTGCNESYQIKTSYMTEALNKELDDYFRIDNEAKDQEVGDKIYIDDLINNYNNSNKYLISVENEYKSKYFCAYLDIRIKDTLDSIEIAEPDGNPGWYVWQGENNYLKKYESAIKKNLIDIDEYCMNWVEFESKEDIVYSYENLFLVCIAKSIKSNVINYETNKRVDKIFIVEENASILWNLIENEEGFFAVLENKIDFSNMTTLDLFNILEYSSFDYKKINKNIYIDLNGRGQEVNYNLNEYKIINERYFYRLDEIINLIEEQN